MRYPEAVQETHAGGHIHIPFSHSSMVAQADFVCDKLDTYWLAPFSCQAGLDENI